MIPDMINTIVIEVNRFSYQLNPDGTRDIDRESKITTDLEFKFKKDALKQIILRTGSPRFRVDEFDMYFDYRRNVLIGIHFETERYIYMVKDYQGFIAQCLKYYISNQASTMMFQLYNLADSISEDQTDKKIVDEFDLEKGYYQEEENDDGRDRFDHNE